MSEQPGLLDEPPPRPFLALESQREQWWTGAALCHRSLEFWPQRLRRKVRGRGLSPPTKSPMFSMNLSAPVVAKAEADAGAYTVGQAAHDLELLRSPATDLPTGQYNVGGTGECAGRVHGGPLPGTRRPPPMSVCGLSGVGLTSAPHRTFADPAPPSP